VIHGLSNGQQVEQPGFADQVEVGALYWTAQ
jgi:hypothetical protein